MYSGHSPSPTFLGELPERQAFLHVHGASPKGHDNQAELTELFNTARSSGPKGRVRLFVPLLKYIGVDISVEQEFKPEEVARKITSFIYGEEMTGLKLGKGDGLENSKIRSPDRDGIFVDEGYEFDLAP